MITFSASGFIYLSNHLILMISPYILVSVGDVYDGHAVFKIDTIFNLLHVIVEAFIVLQTLSCCIELIAYGDLLL